MERRLAAILSADVQGYSALVAADDTGTVVALKECRVLLAKVVAEHRGKVVDNPGDNVLAEFPSALDAVGAAVAIQRELAVRNAARNGVGVMQFRIGVTLGDVLAEDERLYGDGVNIAARLEALAEPGGICVDGSVHDQVARRLPVAFLFLGEQTVKNVARPVAVWKVALNETPAAGVARVAGGWRRTAWLLAASAIVVLAVLAAGRAHWPGSPPSAGRAAASVPDVDHALPAEPSLVVLPFANLSGDPAQEYLSSGITEDLTTDMAKLKGLFVISRSTAFTYRDRAVALSRIGRELGVRYVVQGGVQASGDRLRVTVQLIEASDEHHIWSERYERSAADLFSVQDEIRQHIVTALKVKLSADEQQRFARAPTDDLDAYHLYLQARDTFARARRTLDRSLVDESRALLRQAIERDPDYAAAYGALAVINWIEWVYDWNSVETLPDADAQVLAERALTLDPATPGVRRVLVGLMVQRLQWDRAVAETELEVSLHPSDGEALRMLGYALALSGRRDESAQAMDRALRLNPHYPPYWGWMAGVVYRYAGRTTDALRVLNDCIAREPNVLSNHVVRAAIDAEDGQLARARESIAAIRRISPGYTAEHLRRRLLFRDPQVTDAYVEGLRAAGLD